MTELSLEILKSNNRSFLKNVLFYCLYNLIFLFSYFVLVSMILFFHFLMEHKLSVIEDWIYRNFWELAFIAKSVALIIGYKILSIYLPTNKTVKSFLTERFKLPNSEVIISCLLFFIFLIYIGTPIKTESSSVNIWGQALSFFGTLFFFLSDLLFLAFLSSIFNVKTKKKKILITIFMSLMFLAIGHIAIRTVNTWGPLEALFFSFAYLLLLIYPQNWTNFVFFLCVPICFLYACFGLDPVWNRVHSPFDLLNKDLFFYSLGLMIMFSIYLLFSAKVLNLAYLKKGFSYGK